MKRLASVLALIAISVFLVACGGGGGSSGNGGGNDEAAWVKEVEAVMDEGGGAIEGAEEKINSAKTRKSLEAAYRSYAAQLSTVASKLGETNPPADCESVKSHVVGFLKQFDTITAELGRQSALPQAKFENLVEEDTSAAQAFAGLMERLGSKGHC